MLSSGTPEICNYPFTTRSVKMGHFYVNQVRHQVRPRCSAASLLSYTCSAQESPVAAYARNGAQAGLEARVRQNRRAGRGLSRR